jgi:hypothetical protein
MFMSHTLPTMASTNIDLTSVRIVFDNEKIFSRRRRMSIEHVMRYNETIYSFLSDCWLHSEEKRETNEYVMMNGKTAG